MMSAQEEVAERNIRAQNPSTPQVNSGVEFSKGTGSSNSKRA